MEEGTRLRGWISNSYANIEFLLGDFIHRCRLLDAYRDAAKGFSHSAPQRVAAVRGIIARPGPLDPFVASIARMLDRFIENHELRNLLAHGYCQFIATPNGEVGFRHMLFIRDRSGGGRDDLLWTLDVSLSEMRAHADRLTGLAEDGHKLFWLIHHTLGWIPEQPPPPPQRSVPPT